MQRQSFVLAKYNLMKDKNSQFNDIYLNNQMSLTQYFQKSQQNIDQEVNDQQLLLLGTYNNLNNINENLITQYKEPNQLTIQRQNELISQRLNEYQQELGKKLQQQNEQLSDNESQPQLFKKLQSLSSSRKVSSLRNYNIKQSQPYQLNPIEQFYNKDQTQNVSQLQSQNNQIRQQVIDQYKVDNPTQSTKIINQLIRKYQNRNRIKEDKFQELVQINKDVQASSKQQTQQKGSFNDNFTHQNQQNYNLSNIKNSQMFLTFGKKNKPSQLTIKSQSKQLLLKKTQQNLMSPTERLYNNNQLQKIKNVMPQQKIISHTLSPYKQQQSLQQLKTIQYSLLNKIEVIQTMMKDLSKVKQKRSQRKKYFTFSDEEQNQVQFSHKRSIIQQTKNINFSRQQYITDDELDKTNKFNKINLQSQVKLLKTKIQVLQQQKKLQKLKKKKVILDQQVNKPKNQGVFYPYHMKPIYQQLNKQQQKEKNQFKSLNKINEQKILKINKQKVPKINEQKVPKINKQKILKINKQNVQQINEQNIVQKTKQKQLNNYFIKIPQIPKAPKASSSKQQLSKLAIKTYKHLNLSINSILIPKKISIKKYKNYVFFQHSSNIHNIIWRYQNNLSKQEYFYCGQTKQTHSGQIVQQGNGFLIYINKNSYISYIYKGNFTNGLKNLIGTINFIDISTQNISNCITIYQKDNYIPQNQQNNKISTIYQGQWLNDQMHGCGLEFNLDQNNIYQGDFYHNIKCGYGRQKLSNNDAYLGNFSSKGQYHGKGKYYWANGSQYQGDFVDGLMHGLGRWVSEDGDTYEGQYFSGLKHGRGIYKWKNGSVFQGLFARGKRVNHIHSSSRSKRQSELFGSVYKRLRNKSPSPNHNQYY